MVCHISRFPIALSIHLTLHSLCAQSQWGCTHYLRSTLFQGVLVRLAFQLCGKAYVVEGRKLDCLAKNQIIIIDLLSNSLFSCDIPGCQRYSLPLSRMRYKFDGGASATLFIRVYAVWEKQRFMHVLLILFYMVSFVLQFHSLHSYAQCPNTSSTQGLYIPWLCMSLSTPVSVCKFLCSFWLSLVVTVRGFTLFHSGCLFVGPDRLEWIPMALLLFVESCEFICRPTAPGILIATFWTVVLSAVLLRLFLNRMSIELRSGYPSWRSP